DDELAALLSDSAELALTGVRGGGDRRLAFEAPQLVIEFVLVPGPRGSRLEGQLAPPGPARIEVLSGDDGTEIEADQHGRLGSRPARGAGAAARARGPAAPGPGAGAPPAGAPARHHRLTRGRRTGAAARAATPARRARSGLAGRLARLRGARGGGLRDLAVAL